ncbi:LysR family transcriptional regulator [Erwinia tracheiphila PSU-1]|nr:LysR family transcriptional regulator [Erwinia tracheiphila PSU-1]
MPGRDSVQAWPVAEQMGKISIWLVWRKGYASANLQAMINLLESDVSR